MTADNKIIIIGGSIAGLTAATRARRLNERAQITIIEDSNYIGYHISALPAFVSGNIKKKESLLTDSEENLIEIYNIQVLKNHKAIEINATEKFIKIKNLSSNIIINLPYDKLILACGNKFQKPKIEGINLTNIFTFKNIQDATNILEYLEKTSAKSISIIGSNYYSLITVNMLLNKGYEITLIHDKPDILDDYDSDFNLLIKDELIRSGVTVYLDTQVKKFIKNDKNKASEIELSNKMKIKTHMVIFFHPYIPNIELAQQAELIIGNTGRIKVNQQLMTSNPNIFAIGNIAETFNAITKQADYAERISITTLQARIASTNAAGGNQLFRGIIGTKILKLQKS
jgi:NADPH-dependent 2,4-dienoyl-CoA reductase/sulfur reductase-like enzyme